MDVCKSGYQIWLFTTLEGFTAIGYAGQWISVFPTEDVIVVFTADDIGSIGSFYVDLITTFILPSIC